MGKRMVVRCCYTLHLSGRLRQSQVPSSSSSSRLAGLYILRVDVKMER